MEKRHVKNICAVWQHTLVSHRNVRHLLPRWNDEGCRTRFRSLQFDQSITCGRFQAKKYVRACARNAATSSQWSWFAPTWLDGDAPLTDKRSETILGMTIIPLHVRGCGGSSGFWFCRESGKLTKYNHSTHHSVCLISHDTIIVAVLILSLGMMAMLSLWKLSRLIKGEKKYFLFRDTYVSLSTLKENLFRTNGIWKEEFGVSHLNIREYQCELGNKLVWKT